MTLLTRKVLIGLLAVVMAMPLAIGQARAAYSQAELDQMLAPIALYPDPLLSQVLMASTHPAEVAEAARWSRAHPGIQGDAAVRMVQDRDWDPSVKSLVAFPHVLARMDENLEWTRRLGDAFIVQEPQVVETIQALRRRAQAAGNLASNENLRVVEEPQAIAILPAHPQWIYVPYYDPWSAYGTWWWPAYPPFAWAPWPGYVRAYRPGLNVGFWWGAPVGISVGFFFGGVDWYQRHVRVVHVNNYYVRPVVANRQVSVTPGRWRHDYWQRRDGARLDPIVRPQFTAPAPLRQRRVEEPRRSLVAPSIVAPQAPAPRRALQRPPERRPEAGRPERQPDSRRVEPRQMPASPLSAERAPASRIAQAPAPRLERGPAPRVEHAQAPRKERHERRQETHGAREQQGMRDRQALNR